jgi:outer membrane translocation and assembly module TamA
MRCRAASPVLAIAYLLSSQRAHARVPVAGPQTQNVCPPASTDKQQLGPEVTVAELHLEGDLHMPAADQDQIAAALKQRTYSAEPDGVASEVLEQVRRAWQDHGYFKVEVYGSAKMLTSSPASQRIAVNVQVDEGQQFRLRDVRFNNNRGITNVAALRSLFPLKDGDVFDRAAISKGLDNLRFAYLQLGFLNFTSIPNTQMDEGLPTISLVIDVDEGKKFYVSGVSIIGVDDAILKDSLLKRGEVYDQRLADMFVQEHLPASLNGVSPDSRIHLRLDEQAGLVAVTFDFRPCPSEE